MPYILFGVGLGVLLFAISKLFLRNKRAVHYCLAVGFFSLGYTLFYFWAVLTGFIRYVPALIYSDISITFIIAPAVYLFFITMIYEGEKPVRGYIRYFIVPGVIFAANAVINGIGNPGVSYVPYNIPGHFENIPLFAFSLVADLNLLFFISLTLLRGLLLRRKGGVTRLPEYKILMTFLIMLLAAVLFMLSNYIIQNETLFMIATLCTGLLGLAFYLVSVRMAEYVKGLDKVIINPTHRTNTQWDDEMSDLMAKIKNNIEEQGYFKAPDYRLKDLARKVGKSQAQVSYCINKGMGCNFRTYVNSVRLEHIAWELIESADKSILEIMVDNGFNSKSSFNNIFIRRYELSPREYRKQYGHF